MAADETFMLIASNETETVEKKKKTGLRFRPRKFGAIENFIKRKIELFSTF